MLSGLAREYNLILHPSLTVAEPTVRAFINKLRETEVGAVYRRCSSSNPFLPFLLSCYIIGAVGNETSCRRQERS